MQSDTYEQSLEAFDGNNPAPLKALINQLDSESITSLITSSNTSDKHQIANTWLIKAWQENGNSLTDTQVTDLCYSLLTFDTWSAKLHTYQILESLPVPEIYRKKIHEISHIDTRAEKTILRAWAYFIWAKTAPEGEREQIETTLRNQLKREKGSVAVRLRKALELLS